MPTPEDYAAERLAARSAKYRAEVDRLRELAESRACAADQIAGESGPTVINRQPSTKPTPAYLAARGIRQTDEETEA